MYRGFNMHQDCSFLYTALRRQHITITPEAAIIPVRAALTGSLKQTSAAIDCFAGIQSLLFAKAGRGWRVPTTAGSQPESEGVKAEGRGGETKDWQAS